MRKMNSKKYISQHHGGCVMHCGFSNVQALEQSSGDTAADDTDGISEQWTKRKRGEEEDWKETVRQDLR